MSSPPGRLYATAVGRGSQAAVYLPGLGRHGDDGRQIAEAIGDSHTTYLIDLPGNGRSPASPGVRRLGDLAPVLDRYLTKRACTRST